MMTSILCNGWLELFEREWGYEEVVKRLAFLGNFVVSLRQ